MKTKILKIIFPVVALLLPLATLALEAPGITSRSDIDANKTIGIILGLAEWALILMGVIAVIIALYSAFLFMTSSGNEEQTVKAKKTLIWAMVGILVAVLAFSIVSFTNSLLEPPAPPSFAPTCSTSLDCQSYERCSNGVCIPVISN